MIRNIGGIFSVSLAMAEGGISLMGCSKMEWGRLEAVFRSDADGGSIHLSDGTLRLSSKSVRTKEAMQRQTEVLELGRIIE